MHYAEVIASLLASYVCIAKHASHWSSQLSDTSTIVMSWITIVMSWIRMLKALSGELRILP